MKSEKAQKKLLIGQPWPEGIEIVSITDSDGTNADLRVSVINKLLSLTLILVVGYFIHALATQDSVMLDKVWTLIYMILGGVLGWAIKGQSPGSHLKSGS